MTITAPTSYNVQFPAPVASVTVNITSMEVGTGGDIRLTTYIGTNVSGEYVTLPATPSREWPVRVTKSGVLQMPGRDYEVEYDSARVRFVQALASNDVQVEFGYVSSGTATDAIPHAADYLDQSGASVTLAATPVNPTQAATLMRVYRNGLLLTAANGDYTLSGRDITFSTPLVSDDIHVDYWA